MSLAAEEVFQLSVNYRDVERLVKKARRETARVKNKGEGWLGANVIRKLMEGRLPTSDEWHEVEGAVNKLGYEGSRVAISSVHGAVVSVMVDDQVFGKYDFNKKTFID